MDIERIARMISEDIDEIKDGGSEAPMSPVEFADAVNGLLAAAAPEQRTNVLERLYKIGETNRDQLFSLLSQADTNINKTKVTSFYQEKTSNIVLLAKLVDLIYSSDEAINIVLDSIDLMSDESDDEDEDLAASGGSYNEDW